MKGRLAGVLLLVALSLLAPAAGQARRHRLHRPPPRPAPPTLPRALAADEAEWSITLSQTAVAAGVVTFSGYNRGMDDHDLTGVDPNGRVVGSVFIPQGQNQTLPVAVTPGTYKVICSLFAGTPESHEAKGMRATLTVR